MPCPQSLLERGAVCLALYPYSLGFPLDRVLRDAASEFEAALERHETIDDMERVIKVGDSPEVVATIKLRRVLVLQDGTDARMQDVSVASINSITPKKKAQGSWYKKLQSQIHPANMLIGDAGEHGTNGVEAYVNLLNIMTIQKAAILERTGTLDEDEMRQISEMLMRTLELDLSGYVSRLPLPPTT